MGVEQEGAPTPDAADNFDFAPDAAGAEAHTGYAAPLEHLGPGRASPAAAVADHSDGAATAAAEVLALWWSNKTKLMF